MRSESACYKAINNNSHHQQSKRHMIIYSAVFIFIDPFDDSKLGMVVHHHMTMCCGQRLRATCDFVRSLFGMSSVFFLLLAERTAQAQQSLEHVLYSPKIIHNWRESTLLVSQCR